MKLNSGEAKGEPFSTRAKEFGTIDAMAREIGGLSFRSDDSKAASGSKGKEKLNESAASKKYLSLDPDKEIEEMEKNLVFER